MKYLGIDPGLISGANPCKKCGSLEKTKKMECRICANSRASAWQEANKEKVNEKSAKWRKENPEKRKAVVKAWAIANPEKVKATRERYIEKHKEKINAKKSDRRKLNPHSHRIHEHNRRAKKIKAGGKLSRGIVKKLFVLQKGMCPCCGMPLGADFHVDHKMPLALGGCNSDENIQLLRSVCNMQKNAKDPIDFMQSRGFLL